MERPPRMLPRRATRTLPGRRLLPRGDMTREATEAGERPMASPSALSVSSLEICACSKAEVSSVALARWRSAIRLGPSDRLGLANAGLDGCPSIFGAGAALPENGGTSSPLSPMGRPARSFRGAGPEDCAVWLACPMGWGLFMDAGPRIWWCTAGRAGCRYRVVRRRE